MRIESADDFNLAVAKANELIAEGKGEEAVRLADACKGEAPLLLQLRAVVYSAISNDREILLKAIDMWREIRPGDDVAFQTASTLQGVAELTRRTRDYAAVIEVDRKHLQEARTLYERAAENEDAESHMRVTSWVNLGNSYDFMGRDVDALRCYDAALNLDPDFGMALGNYGITLLGIAPFMGPHQSHVIHDAALALDRAFEDERRILDVGGLPALETFRRQRKRIAGGTPEEHRSAPKTGRFSDPHIQWAYECGLLLHISPSCLTDESEAVDSLHLGRMTVGLDDQSQERLTRLRDAFNAVKQDFIAARYTLWLATDPSSPIRDQTDAISARGYYADTLAYARWGVRTGMALHAVVAATNTLDKIAGLVHLYFDTGRPPKSVYFRGMWHKKRRKDRPAEMEPRFAAELRSGNRGLLALCDLSLDVSGDNDATELKRLVARRHAATHGYLIAHDLPMYKEDEAEWLTRIDWSELVEGAIQQILIVRAALVYLARAIEIHEEERDSENAMPLPSYPVEDFDVEP
ncbi:MAG TPA: LA2681 family HEPN domain-containing protein [Solirubrobacterales bacterium]|jgi:tetratricopeptide (TPR) repeat protein